jgi:twitching motility protein PilT
VIRPANKPKAREAAAPAPAPAAPAPASRAQPAPPPIPTVNVDSIPLAVEPGHKPKRSRSMRAPSMPPKSGPKSSPGMPAIDPTHPTVSLRTKATRAATGGPARIDAMLREMLEAKASDLHLSAGNHPIMRVHGEIHFGTQHPVLRSEDVSALVEEIMSDKAKKDFAELRDCDFAYEIPGLARFRVNVFEDRNGVGSVMRQIPIEILSVEKLGLPKACIDLCWLNKGLVVVTGPTGSGKSTTLAAMIDFINKNRSDHIITIEDPVEFVHKNAKCLVNQREVGLHTKSFKAALRAALREDPDIVLVGEMRDLETIAIAIETAETGHLVFGTLHTTTAVSTVDRIIDQFPTDRQAQIRVMLSESLKGVVAQVLCKKLGGGRVAAHEILLGSPATSNLIREGKTFQLGSVMQTGKNIGMVTMNDTLFSLVQRKLVDPKEAWLKATDKAGLITMYKNANIPALFT